MQRKILFFILISISLLTYSKGKYYNWHKNPVTNIVIYSDHSPYLLKQIFNLFTLESGIDIKYFIINPNISNNYLQTTIDNADVLLLKDTTTLWQANSNKKLRSKYIQHLDLDSTIANYLTNYEGTIFSMAFSAKLIIYNDKNVSKAEFDNYQDLADTKWRNRLCFSDLQNANNKNFLAALIAHNGFKETTKIVSALLDNAKNKYNSDVEVIDAITLGRCDIGLVDSDIYLQNKNYDKNYALSVFMPNQNTTGTYINASGFAILNNTNKIQQINILLKWLTSAKAQKLYSALTYKYPANQNITHIKEIANLGSFRYNKINISELNLLQVKVSELLKDLGNK